MAGSPDIALTAAEIVRAIEGLDATDMPAILAAVASRLAAVRAAPKSKAEDDALLSAKEAADLLGVSTSFLYSGAGSEIPVVKVGRRRMYRRAVIERFIREHSGSDA
jgi:hypothetical protein